MVQNPVVFGSNESSDVILPIIVCKIMEGATHGMRHNDHLQAWQGIKVFATGGVGRTPAKGCCIERREQQWIFLLI